MFLLYAISQLCEKRPPLPPSLALALTTASVLPLHHPSLTPGLNPSHKRPLLDLCFTHS